MKPRDTITVDLAVPDGDPDSLRAAARRLRQVADHGLATAGVRGGAGGELAGVWSGPSAAGAATELAALSRRAGAVLPQVDDGGRALAGYAASLETAIAAARRLSARAGRAADEHRRTLAAIDVTHAVDPVLHAAASARADQSHTTELTGIHRRYGAAMDALTAAGTRCARALAGLTPSVTSASPIAVSPSLDPDLVYDLPLVRGQLDAAAAAGVGHVAPREASSWFDSTLAAAATAGAWAYNHTAVPLVNGAADVVEAAAEHPEDLAQLALGAGMVLLGAGGEVGGVALDATGVGAVAGVPINVVAAGAIAGGLTTAGAGAGNLIQHAAVKNGRLLQEATGPTEPAARPPTSNWSSTAPHASPVEGARQVRGDMPKTAGPNEVLVRRDGNGQVTCYEVYDSDGLPVKRVDLRGKPHGGVPTPHVQEFTRDTNPRSGEQYVKKVPGRQRAARPDEVFGL